jgi:hypothetical protein
MCRSLWPDRLVWLSTARHCLVHRQGKVDQKVLKTLPNAGKFGEKLVVREHEFARAAAAVKAYAIIVGMRTPRRDLRVLSESAKPR